MSSLIRIVASLAVAAAAAASVAHASPSELREQKTVLIDNYSFVAPSVTVVAGTEIKWINKDDDPHTVTADDGSFDSKGLGQGDAFTHVFSKPGRYPYHCAAHPFMKGVVVVSEGSK